MKRGELCSTLLHCVFDTVSSNCCLVFESMFSPGDELKILMQGERVRGNVWYNIRIYIPICLRPISTSATDVCVHLASWRHQRGNSRGLLNTYTASHTWAQRCTAAGVSIASEEEARLPVSLRGRGAITNPVWAADQQQIEGEWEKSQHVCLSPAKQTRQRESYCERTWRKEHEMQTVTREISHISK